MITKPTVLVLGAGASKPYIYPTGQELKTQIIKDLSGGNHTKIKQMLRLTDPLEGGLLKIFLEDFRTSPRSSIDAFLESRPEYMNTGKLAIAQALIDFENPENLISNVNWYHYLFDHMGNKFEDFNKNKLSIITFNYDRSLEQFLFNSLISTYGKSEREVAEALKGLKILHMYGQIGTLPWQKTGVQYSRKYHHEQISDSDLQSSAWGIRIIHEQNQVDLFDEAFLLLNEAEYVYFLGFGYHQMNLDRLRIAEVNNVGKTILGTCMNMTTRRIQETEQRTGNKVQLGLPHGVGLPIREFLDTHVTFI